MLISNFNLYKAEWLDLVFDNRNKEYGAYELRQHYAGNMVKAMGITFVGIGLLCAASIILRPVALQHKVVLVDMTPRAMVIPPVAPIKKIEPPAPAKPLKIQPPAPAVATQRYVPMIVTAEPVTTNPPKNIEITGAIGQTTTTGKTDAGNILPATTTEGTGTTPTEDVSVHNPFGLDVMPEPVGGANAWAKFLSKNLRFPSAAQEEQVSGKVILSFIIEKDGSLSNITVDRPAGHGFDEEALRVLKLAKAWKPGMQNGQPVRVKYSIPINFQLSE
jgi:protein TonB